MHSVQEIVARLNIDIDQREYMAPLKLFLSTVYDGDRRQLVCPIKLCSSTSQVSDSF